MENTPNKLLKNLLEFVEYVSSNRDDMTYKVDVYNGKTKIGTKYLNREEFLEYVLDVVISDLENIIDILDDKGGENK